jgi:DNA-binding transcriptional LysR family regulator
MNGLSADQVAVFLAIVEHGTFAGAAKALKRAQSAVTYAVKRLEETVGEPLFDRTEYRPVLTPAGRALLPNARRIADAVAAFQARAASLSQGLEAEVSIVVDAIFPMQKVSDVLRAFSETFPTVTTQLHVESYARAADLLMDDTCVLGLLNEQSCAQSAAPLAIHPLCVVELVPVVSPRHPLSAVASPAPVEELRGHIRLVLGARPLPGSPGAAAAAAYYGTLWFVSDVAAKRDLLLSAVGWGIMPLHMVEDDLAAGRLVRIQPEWTDYPVQTGGRGQHFVSMCGVYRSGRALGPAASWLLDQFARQA